MKQLFAFALIACVATAAFGQEAGNANYQSQVRYPDANIEVNLPPTANLTISVKGLANLKADEYVAIFSVTQVGKTTEEVNNLLDTRIKQALSSIKAKPDVSVFVDMISFVPVYEYEVEKKVFSKKTYNEVPAGFELKKNIHIKYKNPDLLNEIIANLSAAEIYDLVRVDYFSDKLEKTKSDLMARAKTILQEKVANYQTVLGVSLATNEKHLIDAYRMVYPVEKYQAYQAYSSSSLNLRKAANVNQQQKTVTLYYQPVVNKEFDFVINPTILEPVIQVMYEIKMEIIRDKEKTTANTEYYIITPTGEMKMLNVKK